MLEPHFTRLRSDVADAVRQPDFTTVRQRAGRVRRRRIVTSTAVFLATVLTATGLGYAALPRTADLPAATSETPEATYPQMTEVVTTGTELYGIYTRCQGCAPELQMSADGGDTWQRRTVPPAPPGASTERAVTLHVLGTGMIAWTERTSRDVKEALGGQVPAADPPWITTTSGRTWRRSLADTEPRATVPAGTQPIECRIFGVSTCLIAVVDRGTARFAPLVNQPTGITTLPTWASFGQLSVPLGGQLWIPGRDPVTRNPAIAASSDAGRTWHTHVFTGGVPAASDGDGAAGLPFVAADSGKNAYAVIGRADDLVDSYRTTDGGSSWQKIDTIKDFRSMAGYVAEDGAHIIPIGSGTGFLAGRASGGYVPVKLPGYPLEPRQVAQVASLGTTDRYLTASQTAPYLSPDGRTWRRVDLP